MIIYQNQTVFNENKIKDLDHEFMSGHVHMIMKSM